MGNLEEGLSTGDFESWMKRALGMGHLSLKRLCGGGLRGAPSLGTLEDMLRKSPDTGISLHQRGTWYVVGAHIPGTLIDE